MSRLGFLTLLLTLPARADDATDALAKELRDYAAAELAKVPGKDGGPYLMDHSSIVYLLDRNGRFVTHFTHEAKAETIAAAVKRLL